MYAESSYYYFTFGLMKIDSLLKICTKKLHVFIDL